MSAPNAMKFLVPVIAAQTGNQCTTSVIPAQAGTQFSSPAGSCRPQLGSWIPAFAGMTISPSNRRRPVSCTRNSPYRRRPVSRILAVCTLAFLVACAAPGEKLGGFATSCQSGALPVAGEPQQAACGPTQAVARLVNGSVVYPVLDVLAPNWEARHEPLGADRVRIALRKTGFIGGRDGEAAQLFAQRAGQIAAATGHSGFTILEYTEGIEATFPLAQRVVQGVVRLNR